jgi:hypothetical protein
MPKRPPHLHLSANYHDGQLEGVEFGPRREVVLSVRLDPVWNNGSDAPRRIRFSAIKNYAEVKAFFGGTSIRADTDRSLDEVLAIVRPSKTVIGIDFAKRGYVELQGAKVLEL